MASAKQPAKTASTYTEADIKNLQFPDSIRKRAPLFIGPIDERGVLHILKELLDNVVDEALAGRASTCGLYVGSNEYWVADDGEGVPVKSISYKDVMGKTHKVSAFKAAFAIPDTSGKYEGDAYAASRGCFTGDTPIRLLNGNEVTFKQLYARWQKNRTPIEVMSYSVKHRRLVPTRISHVQLTKRTRHLVAVRLDSGDVIRCTPDHPFYARRNGKIKKVKAEDLRKGESLVSTYYDTDSDGYLRMTENGSKKLVHKRVAEHYFGTRGINQVHHKNRKRADNRSSNLELITQADHHREHKDEKSEFAFTKIMRDQADLREENSERFSDRNVDEDFIQEAHTTKATKVAARVFAKGWEPSPKTYNRVVRMRDPSYAKAVGYLGGAEALWAQAKAYYDGLVFRIGISSRAEDELAWMRSLGDQRKARVAHSASMNWAQQLDNWVATLQEAGPSCTPDQFNVRQGSVVYGRYANLRRYMSLKRLKAYVFDGEELVLFEDQSEEAQNRRMIDAEIRMRTPEAQRRMVATFVSSAKRVEGELNEENYSAVKATCAPQWPFALRLIALQHGVSVEATDELQEFVRTWNHQVVSVKHLHLEDKVPVYDITVEGTHKFFVHGCLVSNTHGLGVKASNALSAEFEAWTLREGKWYHMLYKKGIEITPVETISKAPKFPGTGKPMVKGTLVRIVPDKTIFKSAGKFPLASVMEWATIAAFFTPSFKVNVYLASGKTKQLYFPNGPIDYIKAQVEKLKAEPLSKKAFIISGNKAVDCVVQFTNFGECEFHGFTNGLRNVEGGVHVSAFYKALYESLKLYVKRGQEFRSDDLREGLIGIVNAKMSHPQFDSQTKEKLVDERADKPLLTLLTTELKKFFAANKTLAAAVIDQAVKLRDLHNKFKLSKTATREIKKLMKTGFPSTAIVAPGVPPHRRELILLEGESAKGSASQARLPFQEVLPLKGKILNALRKKDAQVFSSNEVVNILAMIGYNPDAKDDPLAKMRVGKLILMSDPDPDGPLAGDTKLEVVFENERHTVTMAELAALPWVNRTYKVFAWNGKAAILTEAHGCRVTTVSDKTVVIRFEDETKIVCAPNHEWTLYSSKTDPRSSATLNVGLHCIQARRLKVGDRVARLIQKEGSTKMELRPLMITKIKERSAEENIPFYCLTVPAFHNFALLNGAVSKNCHINSLLLALFAKYMPSLYDRHMIYVSMMPQFYAYHKMSDRIFVGSTAKEVEDQVAKASLKIPVSHVKGLGELNPSTLKRIAFDPKTRILAEVQPWKDAKDRDEFILVMGESSEGRKKLLDI